MEKVLIVEDSQIVGKILKHIAKQELTSDVLFATSYAEAKQLCEAHKGEIFAALVDLNLPDAPDGEVVDYTLSEHIPTVVLTGTIDEKRREQLLSKGIVDYVTKEGRYSYQYAVRTINRLKTNRSIKVLVAEDSKTTRKHIVNLLSRHQFEIYEAVDGIDAVRVFLENPDIKMLITDYHMPNMDGAELIKNIRCQYEKFDLVIIALSAEGKGSLSARLIKSGANDFLTKPFNPEEFYCRVNHNVESLHLVAQIRDAANRDYLTELYSRCYFFAKSGEPYLHAQEQSVDSSSSNLSLAVVSIDDFTHVNDQYGQLFGDVVLASFAKQLESILNNFLVARAGGKEFYVLMPGLSNDKATALLDRVRSIVASEEYGDHDNQVSLTLSAGVSNHLGEQLSDMIKSAEQNLHRAKEAGKNIIIGDDSDDEE